jgi:hypothetical protein
VPACRCFHLSAAASCSPIEKKHRCFIEEQATRADDGNKTMLLFLLLSSAPSAGSSLGTLDSWLRDPIKLIVAGSVVMAVIVFVARRMERQEVESRRVAPMRKRRPR